MTGLTAGAPRKEKNMSATAPAFSIPTSAASVIGKTTVIKGEIQSQEPLTIQGQVEGRIEIGEHLLTVAPGADVRAGILARNLEVQGRVEGKVEVAETVYIREDAEFIGEIHASSLVIEEGGYIKGSIDLTRQVKDTPFERGNSPSAASESIHELSQAVLAQ
jgi:cytoskeletal protein CcmA (bactofilin family)